MGRQVLREAIAQERGKEDRAILMSLGRTEMKLTHPYRLVPIGVDSYVLVVGGGITRPGAGHRVDHLLTKETELLTPPQRLQLTPMHFVADIADGAMHHLSDVGSGKNRRVQPAQLVSKDRLYSQRSIVPNDVTAWNTLIPFSPTMPELE